MTMITFPNFYFFIGCLFRLIAYLSCKNDQECWMYDRDQWSAYILPMIGICNAVLINIFMLRVAYVAAILKCQTKEEELKTEIRINIIRSFFLPAYFVLRCCIFVTEYAIFSSIDYDKATMAILIVLLNLLKECLTGTLGIIVLIFSCRLQNIIDELKYSWGNSPPAITRLKTLRNYLLMMGITYLVVDVIYSIILPIFEVLHLYGMDEDPSISGKNSHIVQISNQVEIQFILIFNLQMIFFYDTTTFNVSQFISKSSLS